MPPLALALVLVAALLHALWNIAAKKAGGDHRFAFINAVAVALLWAPVGLAVLWRDGHRLGLLEWGVLALSSGVHLAYFNVLLTGYRRADLTVVYPVARGSGPLASAVGAVLLLGESLGAPGIAGVLGIAGGVFLVAGGPGAWRRARGDAAQRARLRAGLLWGGLTGGCIAAYTLIDGYAVRALALSPILVDYFGHALRIPTLAPVVLRDLPGLRRTWRSQWRIAALIAVASPVSYVLVLYAVTLAPLSRVAPAREVSMLFAAWIGGRLLGEGERGWRLAGAACIAAGVAALALG